MNIDIKHAKLMLPVLMDCVYNVLIDARPIARGTTVLVNSEECVIQGISVHDYNLKEAAIALHMYNHNSDYTITLKECIEQEYYKFEPEVNIVLTKLYILFEEYIKLYTSICNFYSYSTVKIGDLTCSVRRVSYRCNSWKCYLTYYDRTIKCVEMSDVEFINLPEYI